MTYCVETQAKAIGLSVILSWRYEGDTLRETTAGLVHVMLHSPLVDDVAFMYHHN